MMKNLYTTGLLFAIMALLSFGASAQTKDPPRLTRPRTVSAALPSGAIFDVVGEPMDRTDITVSDPAARSVTIQGWGSTMSLPPVSTYATAPVAVQQPGCITVYDGTTITPCVFRLTFNANTFTVAGGVATIGASGYGLPNGSIFTDTALNAFRYGGAASATPSAQSLSMQNGVGTNIAGANFTLTGSLGTGNAASGNIIGQVGYPGSTGTTLETASTVFSLFGVNNQSSGTNVANALTSLTPTVNQSGTAGYDGLLINVTETATGSGTKNILDMAIGGTAKASVSDTGVVLAGDGVAALPGVAFLAQPGVGVYRVGSNILGFSTNGAGRWEIDANGNLMAITDASFNIGATGATRPNSLFLAAPSITAATPGTGITIVNTGEVRRTTYKITLTNAAFPQATKTGDLTIATLPAKARIVSVVEDLTQTFSGGGESAATLKMGTSAGGVDVMASFDAFTATTTKGLADADMGTSLTRAAAIQAGYLPSWTGTTIVNLRLTTTTNNISGLTQGSVTVYITVEVMP